MKGRKSIIRNIIRGLDRGVMDQERKDGRLGKKCLIKKTLIVPSTFPRLVTANLSATTKKKWSKSVKKKKRSGSVSERRN